MCLAYTIGVASAHGDQLVSKAQTAVTCSTAHRSKETGLQPVILIVAFVSFFLRFQAGGQVGCLPAFFIPRILSFSLPPLAERVIREPVFLAHLPRVGRQTPPIGTLHRVISDSICVLGKIPLTMGGLRIILPRLILSGVGGGIGAAYE